MPSNRKGHSVQVVRFKKDGKLHPVPKGMSMRAWSKQHYRPDGLYLPVANGTWQYVASQRTKAEAMAIAKQYRHNHIEVRVLDPMRKVIAHYTKD